MMLAGFETPTNGEIYLDKNPISNIPPHKRGIGMVFQNYALFPHMTVFENLAFPLKVRKMSQEDIEKKSRTGYSIGIGYPPDWGEHTLNIYKGEMTELVPNACFHMIAVMQFGDWGVEASEAIRVTNNGCELFCNYQKELHIKS